MNSLLCFRPMFVVENYLQMRSNVSELLKKLNERISQADIASLSTIEYDLLLQDLRELYDRVIDERKAVRYKESVPEEKVQSFVPPVFEEKEVLHLEVKQPQIHKKVKEPVSEPEVKAPVLTKNAPPKFSVNESAFQHTSLNEKIQPEKKEVHKMFATKPLKDLIDLNKRFVFVKELFNGDGEGFSKTVSIIDSFSDFNSAQIFVEKEISSAYLWDPNAQSTRLFMKLVKQKFGEE